MLPVSTHNYADAPTSTYIYIQTYATPVCIHTHIETLAPTFRCIIAPMCR